jgi:hypothetical protein
MLLRSSCLQRLLDSHLPMIHTLSVSFWHFPGRLLNSDVFSPCLVFSCATQRASFSEIIPELIQKPSCTHRKPSHVIPEVTFWYYTNFGISLWLSLVYANNQEVYTLTGEKIVFLNLFDCSFKEKPEEKYFREMFLKKRKIVAGCWWLMPVILVTYEAEIGRSMFQGQPEQIVRETSPSPK